VPTVADLLAAARARLRTAGVEQPAREAALLLRHLLDMSEAALLARDRVAVSPADARRYEELVGARVRGTPAAHLLGHREFWGRRFAVDRRVLVPRPESEHLVEIALELPLPARARVLEIGTGSGCIAVSLAAERPGWTVVASDLSLDALAVARRNASDLLAGEAGIALAAGDLDTPFDLARVDLLVANLPYVSAGDLAALAVEVREHDPRLALVPPGHATLLVERLLEAAIELRPGAHVALEIGADQGAVLRAFAARQAAWEPIVLRRDLAGLPRNLVLTRSASTAS